MELIEMADSFLEFLRFRTPVYGVMEQVYVRVQRELVHRIYPGQVVQSEE